MSALLPPPATFPVEVSQRYQVIPRGAQWKKPMGLGDE
jgi:hypothetical protein